MRELCLRTVLGIGLALGGLVVVGLAEPPAAVVALAELARR